MSLFVDTSVWSLALRRDAVPDQPAVVVLRKALLDGDVIVTAGIVLQELLQGFNGPKAQALIVERFQVLPILNPSRETHNEAALLRNRCRRRGVQIGTIDALIAQLCIEHDLALLTTDKDFLHAARIVPLRLVL
ncbi:MAG: PIN domain-containing protein [Thermomonas sp.]|uniref:type II toxin-antitoxin system VapC family toxin n=1 Tax=Thermomonas sp. TaxID=1971895 RepID=UPI002602F74A|nr:PIN domain-containing protein [Thermomonas sp.]MCC7096251.1 PIN domain-containing protein [Thermomonas sp.]